MAQADDATITSRRALLGALAVSPLLGTDAAEAGSTEGFAAAMHVLHPNGRRAADAALAAGMKPEQLYNVLVRLDVPAEVDLWPALMFRVAGGDFRTFRPTGRDD